jgi:hypothetical protein
MFQKSTKLFIFTSHNQSAMSHFLKRFYLLSVLVCIVVLFPALQPAPPNQVLLQMPKLDSKNLVFAIQAVQSAPSAQVVSYCTDLNILIVNYDATQTNPEAIVRASSNYNLDYWCEIKDPAGFDLLNYNCINTISSDNSGQ